MTLPAAIRLDSFAGLPLSGLLLSAILGLCTSCTTSASASGADAGRAVSDGQTFTMQPGERVTLSDRSSVRYVEVVADSRCPPDVQCVWAGDAEVAFARTSGSASAQSFTLHTGLDPRSHAVEGRRITLVSLARGAAPQAELRVDPLP